MSIKTRLIKLEEARVNQQAKYSGNNPRLQYMAMLNGNAPKTKSIPQGVSIDPKEAYLKMIGETGRHHEY
ncbi:MAG: hypothetical protein WAW61_15070 [Methylococcaceae bacterium]